MTQATRTLLRWIQGAAVGFAIGVVVGHFLIR